VQRVPLHLHRSSDPSWRQAVISRSTSNATVQMNDAFSVLVNSGRVRSGKWQQVRLFFGEHGCDLAFSSCQWMRVSASALPNGQIRLRLFQALEAHPFKGRFLRVADPRFHFPFAIWILDPARQRHHTVVREDISKQWIDDGFVDVGNQHTFFQVVENHHSRTTT